MCYIDGEIIFLRDLSEGLLSLFESKVTEKNEGKEIIFYQVFQLTNEIKSVRWSF